MATNQRNNAPYDAVIVGAGPAGLTCAIFLGRYRRRVLVIDDAKPRNYASRGVHGFLGQHGILPGDLLARGREEAASAGVEFCDARATKIEQVGDVFEVKTNSDQSVVRARRIVLAYGVRDTLPDIPNLGEFYGQSVHHCPDCDGYESRDKRIGVIAWGKNAAGLALKLLQWSDDVVILTHGHEREWDDELNSKLLAEQVSVKTETIASLEGANGCVESAVLSTGERVPVRAIFFSIHVERTCNLAETLGCECATEPGEPDIVVDEHRHTTIEGVWAVGDLVAGSKLVVTAAADGAIAEISINKSLLPPSRRV
jgi:thioredoxin reductase